MVSRLGFAIATEASADILIVDELLSVGDASFQAKSLERIQRFRCSGTTILFVSHDLKTIEDFCDRVVWLDRGAIKSDGNAREVVSLYRKHSTGKSTAEAGS